MSTERDSSEIERPCVVIAGGASGIGRATSLRLAAWAEVTNLDLVPPEPRGVADIVVDLRDDRAVGRVVAELPHTISGLVYSAGLAGTDDAGEVMWVNVVAFVRLLRRILPRMVPGAAIVVLGSISTSRHGVADSDLRALLDSTSLERSRAWAQSHSVGPVQAYTLSKYLVDELTVELAAILHPRQIRINCVKPGPVTTSLLPRFRESMGAKRIDTAEQVLGRHARADEIAAVIEFLLTESAAWVNGTRIQVDGGLGASLRARGGAIQLLDFNSFLIDQG
ncbi:NAD(P)-dependent dehydrogenase (short-subunit alcohol dehydrogenase family) [Kribbella antiqua]|uniref:NAD(P)-dependent dehydrogenase (Short-subunit alcohol dehydrogenase family) n=1 Tax=Kribbella antiqua TaxID=2512217 RepID=A0A4R2IEF7_9ACTN|nr:SDR family oxidoreductase [Kribbella antiqua]TCO41035.1 NAD(P)-dependent dehydrogenase (short-subunit alcohol dehydrogenase family) [Kribbella antiqua]